jgi:thiamine kinase-like enzyme
MEHYKEIIDTVLNDPSQFRRLKGHNNKNFIYYSDSHNYIVRINDSSTEKVDVGMLPESTVLLFLSEYAFPAPRLIYRDCERNVLVLTYQEGKTLYERFGAQEAISNNIVIGIAKQIKQLHGIGHPQVPSSELFATSPDTRAFYKKYLIATEKIYANLYCKYSYLFKILDFPNDPFGSLHHEASSLLARNFTLCHCDIHRHNVIIKPDNNLCFIDWELAMIGDPLYDIAVHLQKTRYTAEQETLFFQHYADGKDVEQFKNQVQIYRRLETVKYAITDGVRILECIRDGVSNNEITDMIMRYHRKLELAYEVWDSHLTPNIGDLSDAIYYCYSKTLI